MKVLKTVSLSGLIGAFIGYVFGLWCCSQMHASNPGVIFPLDDSVYYIPTALAGFGGGLLDGCIRAVAQLHSEKSGEQHEAA